MFEGFLEEYVKFLLIYADVNIKEFKKLNCFLNDETMIFLAALI